MRNSKLSKSIRGIVVILLVASVAATTIFFVKATWSYIEYSAAKSLAKDAPIYGSTADDLAVIEQQYADRYPVWVVLVAGVQQVVIMGLTIALLRRLYPNKRTKSSNPYNGGEDINSCMKILEFHELKKLIDEFERGDN